MDNPQLLTSSYLKKVGADPTAIHQYLYNFGATHKLYEEATGLQQQMIVAFDKAGQEEREQARLRGKSLTPQRKGLEEQMEKLGTEGQDRYFMQLLHSTYTKRCLVHAVYTQDEKAMAGCKEGKLSLEQLEAWPKSRKDKQLKYRALMPDYLARAIPEEIYIKGQKSLQSLGRTLTEAKIDSLVTFLKGIKRGDNIDVASEAIIKHLNGLNIHIDKSLDGKKIISMIYADALEDNEDRAKAKARPGDAPLLAGGKESNVTPRPLRPMHHDQVKHFLERYSCGVPNLTDFLISPSKNMSLE